MKPISSDTLDQIASAALQDFILEHENDDDRKLVLSKKEIMGIESARIAEQIAGRRKAKQKLASWYKTRGIIYPAALNIEQSSSEATARFKSQFILASIGISRRGVDLTSGFGADSFFLSSTCSSWHCVEPHVGLMAISRHNHNLLGASNITYHHSTAEEFVHASNEIFDFVFIDPSRRNNSKKVVRLVDCEPSITDLLHGIFRLADHVLIKASSLLDLHQGIIELKSVARVLVVAAGGECKELLFWCAKDHGLEPMITAINLDSDSSDSHQNGFEFTFAEEKASTSEFSDPRIYLYEPHAAILKAGAFKTVGKRYGLFKLQVNTHLYTANHFVEDFPGRVFMIDEITPDSRSFGSRFPGGKVNVLTRNYPLGAEAIKKKYRLHDGGERYLIGFSGRRQKFLVEASRILG